MKIRKALAGVALALSGWAIASCGSVLTPPLPTPMPTPLPTPGLPIIMAAGDISCDSTTPFLACKAVETSDLILSQIPLAADVLVLPLGDLQYDAGTLPEFRLNYEKSWGRLNSRSRPVVGNHEYLTRGAVGYYDYFSAAGVNVGARSEGYYSHDKGNWHFIAINTNCEFIGGCGVGSAQYRFVAEDLASHLSSKCTVAYMHYPFRSSGQNGSNPQLLPLMRLLYDNRVDIVLAGHDHDYESFEPINPDNLALDPVRGIRMFVVGTGGRDQTGFPQLQSPFPYTRFRTNDHYGALRIVMKDNAYDWQFVSITSGVVDSGSSACF